MIAVDTSVAVAALAAWHVAHDEARRAAADALIPAHARVETYSVLTRLPPGHRIAPSVAAELLASWFPDDETLVPSAELSRGVVRACSDLGVAGGAVYDALVSLTACEAGALLVTRDGRAARTYERVRANYRLLVPA